MILNLLSPTHSIISSQGNHINQIGWKFVKTIQQKDTTPSKYTTPNESEKCSVVSLFTIYYKDSSNNAFYNVCTIPSKFQTFVKLRCLAVDTILFKDYFQSFITKYNPAEIYFHL